MRFQEGKYTSYNSQKANDLWSFKLCSELAQTIQNQNRNFEDKRITKERSMKIGVRIS